MMVEQIPLVTFLLIFTLHRLERATHDQRNLVIRSQSIVQHE